VSARSVCWCTPDPFSPPPLPPTSCSLRPANLMYDRRVVRGSTYAMPVMPPVSFRGCARAANEMAPSPPLRGLAPLRDLSRARAPRNPAPPPRAPSTSFPLFFPYPVAQSARLDAERKLKDDEFRQKRAASESLKRADEEARRAAGTPPPVAGRAHASLNTEMYLEVLSDRAPEEEAGVQTDAHMDRPPSPIFVPKPVRVVVGLS
jgi:hypothetical protein